MVPVPATDDAPEIRFGVMKKNRAGQYRVDQETTSIPLVVSDPEFRFGFEVRHSRPGNHLGRVVMHVLGSSEGSNVGDVGGRLRSTAIATADVEYESTWGADFRIDGPEDVGSYSVDIIVDGALVRSVKFTIRPTS